MKATSGALLVLLGFSLLLLAALGRLGAFTAFWQIATGANAGSGFAGGGAAGGRVGANSNTDNFLKGFMWPFAVPSLPITPISGGGR